MPLHYQVNVKWSMYSDNCFVAYLYELNDILFLHPYDEVAGPQKNGLLLLAHAHPR
jgi:hypothetical protein